MSKPYTVHLWRDGNMWVDDQENPRVWFRDEPLISTTVQAENTGHAVALTLLKYVDAALQPCTLVHLTDAPTCELPHQTTCQTPDLCQNPRTHTTCAYCVYWSEPCTCGDARSAHHPAMSPAHSFTPQAG